LAKESDDDNVLFETVVVSYIMYAISAIINTKIYKKNSHTYIDT